MCARMEGCQTPLVVLSLSHSTIGLQNMEIIAQCAVSGSEYYIQVATDESVASLKAKIVEAACLRDGDQETPLVVSYDVHSGVGELDDPALLLSDTDITAGTKLLFKRQATAEWCEGKLEGQTFSRISVSPSGTFCVLGMLSVKRHVSACFLLAFHLSILLYTTPLQQADTSPEGL